LKTEEIGTKSSLPNIPCRLPASRRTVARLLLLLLLLLLLPLLLLLRLLELIQLYHTASRY
jgi:hypothetical protein